MGSEGLNYTSCLYGKYSTELSPIACLFLIFKKYNILIIREFHTGVQCTLIVLTNHIPPSPLRSTPTSLAPPNLIFFFYFFNNPLSPFCAAPVLGCVGPSTEARAVYQDRYLNRNDYSSLSSHQLSIAPQREAAAPKPLPVPCWSVDWLGWSWAGNHSFKFMRDAVLLCAENSFAPVFPDLGSYNLSASFSTHYLPCGLGDVMWCTDPICGWALRRHSFSASHQLWVSLFNHCPLHKDLLWWSLRAAPTSWFSNNVTNVMGVANQFLIGFKTHSTKHVNYCKSDQEPIFGELISPELKLILFLC